MSSRSLLAIALKFLLLFSLPSFAYSAETASSADSLLKLHQLRLAAQKVSATSICTTAWKATSVMHA